MFKIDHTFVGVEFKIRSINLPTKHLYLGSGKFRNLSTVSRSSLIISQASISTGQHLGSASRLPCAEIPAPGPVSSHTLLTLDQLYAEKLGVPSTAELAMADNTNKNTSGSSSLPAGNLKEEKEKAIATPTTPIVAHNSKRRKTGQADDTLDKDEEAINTTITPVKQQQRKRRQPDPLPCIDPTPELLRSLEKSNFTPPPLPVPNLGYACLCMELRELKPTVFTSRDCIKRTLDAKGVSHLGELTLANCKDLARVIQYNKEKNIRFFRMSSVLQPWMGVHDVTTLPQYKEICTALKFAGDLARKYGQRLTFHPSHFVKLAGTDTLVAKSISELEGHSRILDLMGYTHASLENKINIHIGGVYANKASTLQRWAENYKKLSPNCRARLTVENDDIASAYSVDDLLVLHRLCDGALPIVFDFHHYKFCPGEMTEEQALRAAIATWPQGVRPVVHWSESQVGRRPHAHSDYVRGPIFLHGLEAEVDVMIESKCKERALLAYRDGLPIPEGLTDSLGDSLEDEDGEDVIDAEAL
jgi:UV DNA damage endonuclease